VSGNKGNIMAVKRLTRKFSEVVAEVQRHIIDSGLATEKELKAWRLRAQTLPHKFPHSTMVLIEDMWIDYEVQRDVIYKHVINIMKKWDPRICSPGSACCIKSDVRIMLYDAQHRSLAAALLGFKEVPCAVVHTNDPNFPSYAFELLNDTGVKRLTPGDLHRNALVRYKNGSRDIKVVKARKMQDQFDKNFVDLQDKASRNSDSLRGENPYFFSHFKYAQKAIDVDESGKVLDNILNAITTVFPDDEEVDQGVFIGLYELHRISEDLPNGWMIALLKSIALTFKSSAVVHAKGRAQWEYVNPGATWSAPSAMSNFMRELHIISGGTMALSYHGEGSKMGIEEGNYAPGLFPKNIVERIV
jgi:hypothetical protein